MAGALKQHRGLKIRSGLVGDGYLDLLDSGALDTATPDACLTALVVGCSSLYAALSHDSVLGFAPANRLVEPIPGSPLMAINSAIEVALCGQVSAELLGGRYVGAVGAQTDYFRAARRSEGGLAILAIPATTGRDALSEHLGL
ncbi:acetyl-CoA hydrolase/transferase C-terminal domain-containing protein [Hydrogenophaga sp. BPS33]|uniref:acetyl-CoA hydrolase/transferase C-terminal domain-containing protein n=1 Tax=Hydrogenophaga sp. BPS33 TaxID=2651974 RepID=UPI00131F6D35|nr:acetyl-CoA hydrolase/transferase C-terminal domain-containing protein [Hydrogenophaga sp. BPS33]QHE85026.1 hypothetical protein F9K07_09075 [Hydrogenophaga sp. BPS33]